MKTHADNTKDDKNQSVAGGLPQQHERGESAVQFADNGPGAAAQRKMQDMANDSPQVQQLKAYRDMANSSQQVQQLKAYRDLANSSPQVTQLKAYKEMANNGAQVKRSAQMQAAANTTVQSQAQNEVVQRTVMDGENPVDIDAFITTYIVPQYAARGVTPAEAAAVTAEIKSKIAHVFGPDPAGDEPMTLDQVRYASANGGMGFFGILNARDAVRNRAEQARLAALPPAVAEAEPAPAEAEPTAATAEPTAATAGPVVASATPPSASGAGAGVQQAPASVSVVASAAPVRAAGNPNGLATSKFHSLGGGLYGSTTEVVAADVDRSLARNSIKDNVRLTVLTGTHGDTEGWLIGEESFASSDSRALAAAGIVVINVNGRSKADIPGMIDGATTPAVLLAWCFSKQSNDNWDDIHAIFTSRDEYLELNEKLRELIEEADDICESAVKKDQDRYEVVKTDIASTKGQMAALFDW